jgi:hypothetical protein
VFDIDFQHLEAVPELKLDGDRLEGLVVEAGLDPVFAPYCSQWSTAKLTFDMLGS